MDQGQTQGEMAYEDVLLERLAECYLTHTAVRTPDSGGRSAAPTPVS